MNTPISNKIPYNTLHIVFAFLSNHSVFEVKTLEMQLYCSIVLSLPPLLISIILRFR